MTHKQALQALEKLKYVEKGPEGYAICICFDLIVLINLDIDSLYSGIRKMTTNGQKAMDTIAKVTSFA